MNNHPSAKALGETGKSEKTEKWTSAVSASEPAGAQGAGPKTSRGSFSEFPKIFRGAGGLLPIPHPNLQPMKFKVFLARIELV